MQPVRKPHIVRNATVLRPAGLPRRTIDDSDGISPVPEIGFIKLHTRMGFSSERQSKEYLDCSGSVDESYNSVECVLPAREPRD